MMGKLDVASNCYIMEDGSRISLDEKDYEPFEWNFTRQQNEMIKCIGKHYQSGTTPLRLEAWMFIWAMEVSPRIPVASVLKVYDWMKETGYYDYEVLL